MNVVEQGRGAIGNVVVRKGLALYRFGRGRPLLFMPYPHGVSVVGDSIPTAIIEGLVKLGRQVVTFDPPGAGRSRRPMQLTMEEMIACAEESLEAWGIEGAVDVLGHSQGGLAALALALERPQRVARLMLVCTAAGAPAYLGAPGAIWNRTHPDFWRVMGPAVLYRLTGRRAPETLMLNAIFRASWVDRRHFQPRAVSLRDWAAPAHARTRWGMVARRLDYSSRLSEIAVPTLVISGRHDPQMPPACGQELAAGIEDARLVVFEHSGHYPFMEEPEVFWRTVREFLGGGGGARGRDKWGRKAAL